MVVGASVWVLQIISELNSCPYLLNQIAQLIAIDSVHAGIHLAVGKGNLYP
jgi:hypothetical protein